MQKIGTNSRRFTHRSVHGKITVIDIEPHGEAFYEKAVAHIYSLTALQVETLFGIGWSENMQRIESLFIVGFVLMIYAARQHTIRRGVFHYSFEISAVIDYGIVPQAVIGMGGLSAAECGERLHIDLLARVMNEVHH